MLATALQERLARLRATVDAALEQWLVSTDAPPLLAEAIAYPVAAGGKRLRPILCLASAEAVGPHVRISEEEAYSLALPAACALELIHTYSLVHDDLPAMDNDTLRRGRATAHVVYGDGIAVLVGDALLTRAFELLAFQPPDLEGRLAQRKLQAIALIARAAGMDGMVGGQAIDLAAAGRGKPGEGAWTLDPRALRDMHARKTGALIRAASVSGAMMAGADAALLGTIDRYATDLGLAFQIIDDILDVEGEAADLGKTTGKDAAAGKPTYPALFGLEASRRMAVECVLRATTALDEAGIGGLLPDLARWVLTRKN
jgi:geranylgeranyl pyrophosphate synthase